MQRAEIDLSAIYPLYEQELRAFQCAARAVARDIFWEHLRQPLAAAPQSLISRMVYRQLDLDAFARDPAVSGLAAGSVDCVVLEHVLYDVADLHATLLALRKLLRPDGALICTGAFRGHAATFFPCEMLQLTLASYRRAQLEPPYRTQAGYLSLAEWELSLTRAGFQLFVQPSPADQERLPHGEILALPIEAR